MFFKIRLKIARKISSLFLNNKIKSSSFFRRKLCYLILPPPTEEYVVPTVFGQRIFITPLRDKIISKDIYYFGEYEGGLLYVLRKILKPKDIFIDVGASIGLMTITASDIIKEKGHIYTFEPYSWANKILQYNIKLNNIDSVTTFKLALGSKDKRAMLFDNYNKNPGAATLLNTESETPKEVVSIISLDKMIKNEKVEMPTVIKIDVQGYELEVLKGSKNILSSDMPPILIVEFSHLVSQKGGSLLDLYRFIKDINNYHIYKLHKSKTMVSKVEKITDEKELPYHDNILCFPEIYISRLYEKFHLD